MNEEFEVTYVEDFAAYAGQLEAMLQEAERFLGGFMGDASSYRQCEALRHQIVEVLKRSPLPDGHRIMPDVSS